MPEEQSTTVFAGRYRLARLIGRGGMASVHEAVDERDNRPVAVKLLPTAGNPEQTARFEREVAALARLAHPHIVPVLASGVAAGQLYYVMEYVPGWSLATVLDQLRHEVASPELRDVLDSLREPAARVSAHADSQAETAAPGAAPQRAPAAPPVEQSGRPAPHTAPAAIRTRRYIQQMTRIARDAARALAHAHDCGVVHRDVKPANFLIDHAGDVHVSDFGLASVAGEQNVTIAGELLGTPRYMSPEQIAAGRVPIDARTDVYSLGTTLYEMLTLTPPHESPTREGLLQAIAVKQPRPVRQRNPGVPPALAAIVQCAIEKDPDARYASMAALADDLDRFLQGRRVLARSAGPLHRFWRRRSRTQRVMLPVLAVALVAGLVIGVQQLAQRAATAAEVAAEPLARAARRASRSADWPGALARYAAGLRARPSSRCVLQARYALARSPEVYLHETYLGPGPRISLRGDGYLLAYCNAPHEAAVRELRRDGRIILATDHETDDFLRDVQFTAPGDYLLAVGQFVVSATVLDERSVATFHPVRQQVVSLAPLSAPSWLLLQTRRIDRPAQTATHVMRISRRDGGQARFSSVSHGTDCRDAAVDPTATFAAGLRQEGRLMLTALADKLRWQPQPGPAEAAPLTRVWCPLSDCLVALDENGGVFFGRVDADQPAVAWDAAVAAAPPDPMRRADQDSAAVLGLAPGRVLVALPVAGADGHRFALRLYDAATFEPVGAWVNATAALVMPQQSILMLREHDALCRLDVANGDNLFSVPVAPPPIFAAHPPGHPAYVPPAWSPCPAWTSIGDPWGLSVDPDARLVLCAAAGADAIGRAYTLHDLDDGRVLARWAVTDANHDATLLTPGGQRLVSTRRDGRLLVSDLQTILPMEAPPDEQPAPTSAPAAYADLIAYAPCDTSIGDELGLRGIGATADARLVWVSPDATAAAPADVPTALSGITHVAIAGHLAVASDTTGHCVLIDMRCWQAAGRAARAAAACQSTFAPPAGSALAAADASVACIALSGTPSADLQLLAVACGTWVEFWLVRPPTVTRPDADVLLLGAALPAALPSAAPVTAMRFTGWPDTWLSLVVQGATGIGVKRDVLAPPPRVDPDIGSAEAWRRHVLAWTGYVVDEQTGAVHLAPVDDWQYAREWIDPNK